MPEPKKPAPAAFDLKQLNELAKWLEGTGLEEVEIESHGTRLRLRKPGAATTMVAAAPAPAASAAENTTPNAQPSTPNAAEFKSPMVGTFYRAGSPDAAPFVQEGDKVTAGQPLAIIEAMKTMNTIESDRAGTVTKVLAQNAQAVEYGQPLFIIQ